MTSPSAPAEEPPRRRTGQGQNPNRHPAAGVDGRFPLEAVPLAELRRRYPTTPSNPTQRPDTTDQFMWGYQQLFRLAVESKTRKALSRIGLPVEVRVVLVGFVITGDVRHRVCVEPEDGPFTTGHLSGVRSRASELYEADPDSKGVHTDPRVHERWHASLRQRFRAAALVETIEASGVFEGFTFFASRSAPIGGYEVHTCVGVPMVTVDSLPALEGPVVDRIYVGRSLQHEVIAECLRRADRALYSPDPGTGRRVLGPTENIVQAAAARLTDGMMWRAGRAPTDLFRNVNAFTSLSYERTAARGHLVVANRQNIPTRTHIRFQEPIRLRDSKIMRKLLELSDESTSVITDGQKAYGLGTRGPATDAAEISVRDHAEWELSVDGKALMRVTYGKAKLPSPPLPRHKVDETAQRTLGSIDMDLFWPIIEEVRNSGHGTILVVSNHPDEEAARLGRQAVPIVPEHLPPEEIARLGRVDGAVLLGPDGRCHAFGVILDGAATGHGDPARGSRFNSAVRYHKEHHKSLLVVISDDGPVDLVPDLRPQVHRDEVEEAVHAFCETCDTHPVDSEQFGRTYDQVKALAFYLNKDQCQQVNDAYKNEMRRRSEAEEWAEVSPTLLSPYPEMDKSYFH